MHLIVINHAYNIAHNLHCLKRLERHPPLKDIFERDGAHDPHGVTTYRRYGYRLREIAAYLGVHYATVSRQLAQAEKNDV